MAQSLVYRVFTALEGSSLSKASTLLECVHTCAAARSQAAVSTSQHARGIFSTTAGIPFHINHQSRESQASPNCHHANWNPSRSLTTSSAPSGRLDRSPLGAHSLPALVTGHGYIPRAPPPISQWDKGIAKATNLRISVKKLNVVAKLVRRMHVDDALIQLTLLQKKAARILTEVIRSARANASNDNRVDTSELVVDEIVILRSKYLAKRPLWRAKGGVHMPSSAHSHIYARLRSVPGSEMKTIILKPWWERRYRHRGSHAEARLLKGNDDNRAMSLL